MKFSILAIAGALASANVAAIRGDAAALKKLAVMQQFTNAFNKKTFGVIRRLDAENNAENNGQNQGQQEITTETVIQPYVCTTATVYTGNQYGFNDQNGASIRPTMSYLSFISSNGQANNANNADNADNFYGDNDEYMTTLSAYLSAVGVSYANERANLCEDCEQMKAFCELDEEQLAYFAAMTEDEFAEWIENVEQQNKQKQQEQNENMENEENAAYAAYQYGNYGGRGRRHLFESLETLCDSCEQYCTDGQEVEQSREYYEELAKLFEESMCTQAPNGQNYIGHTCGNDGRSIELALFMDQDCLILAEAQNPYSYYQVIAANYNDDVDGDGQQDNEWNKDDLAYSYMSMVSELYANEFSCSMGAVRDFDGSEPSEACTTLFEDSISRTECEANNANNENENNYNYANNAEYENEDENSANYGYDLTYGDEIADSCAKLFELEDSLLSSSYYNPFSGMTFTSLFQNGKNWFHNQNGNLSDGAIAGIAIAVVAVVAAAVAAIVSAISSSKKKSDLEEPVFQGGALS